MQRHYNGQDAPNWTIDDIRKATGVGAAELAEARVIGETTLKTEVTISSSPSFLAEVKQATERHQRVSINQSASNGHFGLDGLSNIAGGKIEHLFELTEHKATCANDYRASFSTENSSVPIYSALDPAGLVLVATTLMRKRSGCAFSGMFQLTTRSKKYGSDFPFDSAGAVPIRRNAFRQARAERRS